MKRSKPINSSSGSKPKRPRADGGPQSLRELQGLMGAILMRPLTHAEAMQPRWVDGRTMRAVASSFIKPNDRLTAFERLEIYNRQYWFRVLECFYDDYPGLRAVMGDKKFEALAEAYLTKYPSHSFTLRNLGDRLLQFLGEEPQWTATRHDLILDMARLEWAQIEAFDNEAVPVLIAKEIRGLDPAKIHLGLQPYLTLLELRYPVDDYLLAVKKGDTQRDEVSNAVEKRAAVRRKNIVPLPRRQPVWLAVHRMEHSVYYKRLEPEAFQILSALQRGTHLAEACTGVAVAPARVQEWFGTWASLGWFSAR